MQRTRIKQLRRRHDLLTEDLYNRPETLGIPGINGQSIIWKTMEYRYLHSLRDKEEKGKRERYPGPDIVFLYDDADKLKFLVIDVKNNFLGKGYFDGHGTMERATKYFRGMWRSVVIDDLKQHLINKVVPDPAYRDVSLDLIFATKEFGRWEIIPYGENIHLGGLRVRNGNVQFQQID